MFAVYGDDASDKFLDVTLMRVCVRWFTGDGVDYNLSRGTVFLLNVVSL